MMIPIVSDIIKNPGVLVGMGLGLCIGFIMRSPFSNDSKSGDISEKFNESDNEEDDEDSSEEGSLAEDSDNMKLVLVVRTDLKMGKGKIAAQCCHATLKAYQQVKKSNPNILRIWESSGQPKVVVKVDSEEALLELAATARTVGLKASLIQDAGRTQVEPGSRTVLGVGPGPIELVDTVTGHLKLY